MLKSCTGSGNRTSTTRGGQDEESVESIQSERGSRCQIQEETDLLLLSQNWTHLEGLRRIFKGQGSDQTNPSQEEN